MGMIYYIIFILVTQHFLTKNCVWNSICNFKLRNKKAHRTENIPRESWISTISLRLKNPRRPTCNYDNDTVIENVYDALDRIAQIKYNGNIRYNCAYNGNGDLAYVEDVANDTKYRYEYDSVEWGKTFTIPGTEFNIFDVSESIYRKIMEW